MTLPEYLRPIRNPATYKFSRSEKVIRSLVFVPILLVFAIPAALGLFFGFWSMPFIIHGIANIFKNPVQYDAEQFYLIAGIIGFTISIVVIRVINRYFLRFG